MHILYNAYIVCLLSLELFILGVQATKLHFCNLKLILNKTGYSHVMENKIVFHFLTWEPVEENLTSSFFKFSPEPARMFGKKIKNF